MLLLLAALVASLPLLFVALALLQVGSMAATARRAAMPATLGVQRLPNRFASWTGTAPLDTPSGEQSPATALPRWEPKGNPHEPTVKMLFTRRCSKSHEVQ
jgi:hypothetical protein